jgi:hypothetical protein
MEEKERAAEQERKANGLVKEPRHDITLVKSTKYAMLDANIAAQRDMGAASLPGKSSEINSVTESVHQKIYLR